MQIIISIIAILLMILIHEWGHFIAGRICKNPILSNNSGNESISISFIAFLTI